MKTRIAISLLLCLVLFSILVITWSCRSKEGLQLVVKDLESPLDRYRLGDAVKGRYKHDCGLNYEPHSIEGTLVNSYLKATEEDNDYEVLNDLVLSYNKKNGIIKPEEKTLVVHLRLGDYLQMKCGNDGKRIAQTNDRGYITGKGLVRMCRKYNLHKVRLIGGSHRKSRSENLSSDPQIDIDLQVSLDFINELKRILEESKIRVSYRFGAHPDRDFCEMAVSKYFVKSFGGFSRLLGILVKMNGGQVIPISFP